MSAEYVVRKACLLFILAAPSALKADECRYFFRDGLRATFKITRSASISSDIEKAVCDNSRAMSRNNSGGDVNAGVPGVGSIGGK